LVRAFIFRIVRSGSSGQAQGHKNKNHEMSPSGL